MRPRTQAACGIYRARSAANLNLTPFLARLGLASSQPDDGIRELGIVAQTLGEGDVGQAEVVLAEEFAEGAQALELGGAIDAVAAGGARVASRPTRSR